MTISISPSLHVAVIGLGTMGQRIAARILSSGARVTVYNRTPSRATDLEVRGARIANSAAEAVVDADVVFTCLRGDDAEMGAVNGPQGILTTMKRNAVHITLSTLSPAVGSELSGLHNANGTRYLCCQMQGRAQAAEAGQLLLWASGDEATLAEVSPLLSTFSVRTCYLGPEIEKAPATKLAVNMLMFSNIELFAETFNYLQRCQIDPSQVFGVLNESMFATPLFKGIAGALRSKHESDGTTVGSSLLDLELLLDHARSVAAGMPTVEAVSSCYARTAREGHENLSQSAVLLSLQAA